ncbi:MAG: hypothetical protein IT364_14125, partial [Candidatus Hydrogenedentes bacterium]|nr:hypothetical protein [Candidatus Hydrogenedentota bacterium]
MDGTATRERLPFAGAACVCAAGVLLAVLATLLGWNLGTPQIADFGEVSVPMAPSTAVLFALLAIAVIFRTVSHRRSAAFWVGLAINVAGASVALILFVLSLKGVHPPIERMGFPAASTLDGVPLGHMSPATAAFFVLACVSYLLPALRTSVRAPLSTAAFWLAAFLTAATLVFLLAYSLGKPLLYGGTIIPPAESTCFAFVLLGAALMFLAAPDGWRPRDALRFARKTALKLALVLILLCAGFISAGRYYLLAYENRYRAEFERKIGAVADLKVSELSQWRAERLGDAEVLHENKSFRALVRRSLAANADADAMEELRGWLRQIESAYQYERVYVCDGSGAERVATRESPLPAAGIRARMALEAMRAGRVVLQDFYRDEADGRVYLSLFAPIRAGAEGEPPLGAVGLDIDPERFLYPFLGRWPTPSETAETLLVRREGNEAVFLNELRKQRGATLNLRSPVESKRVPAVQAVLGRDGVFEGIDYHGVPVIACLRKIPDSPWFLVAKMDLAEIYGPLREQLWGMVALVSALLVGAWAWAGLIWRQQRVRFYRERYEVAAALRASQERYRHLLDNMLEGLQIIGFDWRYRYLNDTAVRSARQSREDLLGHTVMECFPGIEETPA